MSDETATDNGNGDTIFQPWYAAERFGACLPKAGAASSRRFHLSRSDGSAVKTLAVTDN
jgi:hypothetical protein